MTRRNSNALNYLINLSYARNEHKAQLTWLCGLSWWIKRATRFFSSFFISAFQIVKEFNTARIRQRCWLKKPNVIYSANTLSLVSRSLKKLVGLGRLELPTSPLSGVRSNQLSYRPILVHRISGGAKQDRTADLLRARQALSQLSYSPSLGNILNRRLVRFRILLLIKAVRGDV